MDKKLLVAIALSLGTVWLFNHYTAKKIQQQPGVVATGQQAAVVPGQPIKVPTTQELYRPLNLDVVLSDAKLSAPEQVIEVKTPYWQAAVSTYGAVLTQLDFKEHFGKGDKALRTIQHKGSYDSVQRKKGCFLLAFEQAAPYLYTLVSKQESTKGTQLCFKAEHEGWEVFKTYFFHNNDYVVDITLGFQPIQGQQAKSIRPRLFFTAPFIGELGDDPVSVVSWNEADSRLDTVDLAQSQGLAWFWTAQKPLFGVHDRYFIHSLVDDPARFVQRAYLKQGQEKDIYPILEGPQLVSDKKEWKMSFYMGPKLFDHLGSVDDRLEDVMSFGWLSWLCKLLLKLLDWLSSFIGNFGLAIIVMTVILKLPFTPLSIYSRKQMEIYQHYLPSINKIRMKYRHDVKLQHEEMMKFYKDHNISPTTHFVGCLPLLIQMPILFALYRVLNNYLDLYQAPFIGWIVDLSAKDPYYVLPVLMGISMIWQQMMTPSSDQKQKVIMWFMSIVMTVVFANFPAGLVLYWFMNNMLTIGEDYLRRAFFR